MTLNTINDWKKLVSKTAKHFEQKKWTQITGALAEGHTLMNRCFNGGMLCNLGFDLSKIRDLGVYGEEYYEKEGHKISFKELIGIDSIICSLHGEEVSYCRRHSSIPLFIGHLNDEHKLKGQELAWQFYKDVNTAIRKSKTGKKK